MSDKEIIIHVSEKNTSNSDPNGACFVCIIKQIKRLFVIPKQSPMYIYAKYSNLMTFAYKI